MSHGAFIEKNMAGASMVEYREKMILVLLPATFCPSKLTMVFTNDVLIDNHLLS
jgi:hypothetical protein